MPDSLGPIVSATAPRYKYYTVDILSNNVIGEIPFEDVSYGTALKQAGSFDGKISINDQTTDLDLYSATLPGKTALFVVRDGVCAWGGIIWGRSYDMVSRSLTISASEFTSYLSHRLIWKDYSYSFKASLLKTKIQGDYVLVEATDRTFDSVFPLTDSTGARNKAYITFGERSVTKHNGLYALQGVADGAPNDPSPHSFYIKMPKLPTPSTGAYNDCTVNVRTDTYDYLRQLLNDVFSDFTQIDFANEIIAPGINKSISVTQYKIDRINDFSATATLYTNKPHKLAVGQFIETANIHELLTRSMEVIETPTPYSFVVSVKNPLSLDGKADPLDIDSVSLSSPVVVKERVQYREIVNNRTGYISHVKRTYEAGSGRSTVVLTLTGKHRFTKDDVILLSIPGGSDITNSDWGKKKNTFDYTSWNNTVYVKSVTGTTITFDDPEYIGSKYDVARTALKNSKLNTVKLATPKTEFRLWPAADSHGYAVGDRVKVENVDGLGWATPIYDGYNTINSVSNGESFTVTHYSAVDATNLVTIYTATDPEINSGDFITIVSSNELLSGVHRVSVGSLYDDATSSYMLSFTKVVRLDDESDGSGSIARTSVSGTTVSVKGTSWVIANRTYDQLSSVSLSEPDATATIATFEYFPPTTLTDFSAALTNLDRAARISIETVDRHKMHVGDKVNVKFSNAADQKLYGGNNLTVLAVKDYDQVVYAIPPSSKLPTKKITRTSKKGSITRSRSRIGQIPIVEVQISSIKVDGNLVTVISEDHDLNVGEYIKLSFNKDNYEPYENEGEAVQISSITKDSFSYYLSSDLPNSSEFIVKSVSHTTAIINGKSRKVTNFKVITDNLIEPVADGLPSTDPAGQLSFNLSITGITDTTLKGNVFYENTSATTDIPITLSCVGGTINPTSVTATKTQTGSVAFTVTGLTAGTEYTVVGTTTTAGSFSAKATTSKLDGTGGTGSATATYPLAVVSVQPDTLGTQGYISAVYSVEASDKMSVAVGDTVTVSGLDAVGSTNTTTYPTRSFNVIKVVHTVNSASSRTGTSRLYFPGDPNVAVNSFVRVGGSRTSPEVVAGVDEGAFTERGFTTAPNSTIPGTTKTATAKLWGLQATDYKKESSLVNGTLPYKSYKVIGVGPSTTSSGVPTGNYYIDILPHGVFSVPFSTPINLDGWGTVTFPQRTGVTTTTKRAWNIFNATGVVVAVIGGGTGVKIRMKAPVGYASSGITTGTANDVSNLKATITVSRAVQVNPGEPGSVGGTTSTGATDPSGAGSGVVLIPGATTMPPDFSVGDTVNIRGFKNKPNTKLNVTGAKIVAVGATGALNPTATPPDNRQYRIFSIISPDASESFANIGLSAFGDDHVKGAAYLKAIGSAVVDYTPTSTDVRDISDVTRTGYSTATVTIPGHGLENNDWVNVWVYGKKNISFNHNNVPVQISSVTEDTFSYSLGGSTSVRISHILIDASAGTTSKKSVILETSSDQRHSLFPGDQITLSEFPTAYSSKGLSGTFTVVAVTPRTISIKLPATATVTSTRKVKLSSRGLVTVGTIDNQSSNLDEYDGIVIPAPMIIREPVAFSRSYGEFPKNANLGGMEFSTSDFSQLEQKNDVLLGSDLVSVAAHLEKYSNNINGFDYRIDCQLIHDPITGNKRFKKIFKLIPLYPEVLASYIKSLPLQDDPYDPNSTTQVRALSPGQVAPPVAFGAEKLIFEYPGNITNINFSENAESSATRVFVTSNNGNAGGGSAAFSGASSEDLLAAGWPILDKSERVDWGVAGTDKVNVDNWGNYDAELDLYKSAKRFLYESKPPAGDFIISMNGSLNPVIGTFAPGDWCSIVVNDQFIKTRLASPLEPRKDVIIRKIDAIKVTVPNNPAFPEQIDLTVVPDWQVDRVGE